MAGLGLAVLGLAVLGLAALGLAGAAAANKGILRLKGGALRQRELLVLRDGDVGIGGFDGGHRASRVSGAGIR